MENKTKLDDIISDLNKLEKNASNYFDQCVSKIDDQEESFVRRYLYQPDVYWSRLGSELQNESSELTKRIISLSKKIANLSSNSILVDTVDQRDFRKLIKSLRASLQLRSYYFNEANVAHDEGQIIGFIPENQSEEAIHPNGAKREFNETIYKIRDFVQLLDEDSIQKDQYILSGEEINRYRRNTAFIMMWMDDDKPELEDVKDTFKEVFRSFGIEAVRADDIEHQDVITKKIIDEIKTSEFLVADLTGARPSVYYEVGYAHAIGKRVILFRKKGTKLHFDLAGYNCPEYENLRDLRDQLSRRIESMTGKKPK